MWGTSGGGSVCKAREGCNFSWGFGYMRQGGRRDVTTGNQSIPVRTEAIGSGASTSFQIFPGIHSVSTAPDTAHRLRVSAGEREKMEGCGVGKRH